MQTTEARKPSPILDAEKIRTDFPILAEHSNGKPLIYLNSAASGQKPRAMVDRLAQFYLRSGRLKTTNNRQNYV